MREKEKKHESGPKRLIHGQVPVYELSLFLFEKSLFVLHITDLNFCRKNTTFAAYNDDLILSLCVLYISI